MRNLSHMAPSFVHTKCSVCVGFTLNRKGIPAVLVQLCTRVSIRAQARARRSISQGRLGYAPLAFQEI